jgi:hypothetical protein
MRLQTAAKMRDRWSCVLTRYDSIDHPAERGKQVKADSQILHLSDTHGRETTLQLIIVDFVLSY